MRTLAPGTSWVVTFTVITQPTAPKVRMVSETSTVSAAKPDPLSANNRATKSTALAVKR